MTLLRLVLVSWVLLLIGCGGSGNSGDPTISISTTKIDFQAVQNAADSPKASVDVQFNGDGAIVGYPTGVTPATWLDIQVLSTTSSNAKVQFSLKTAHAPGKYSTTVRFQTSHADGSALTFVDVAVSAEIFSQFNASAPKLAFEQVIGAESLTTPTLGHEVTIVGDKAEWNISANVDWLTFSKTSGKGPGKVTVTVQKNAGAGAAQITVSDSQSGRSTQLAVTVTRQANPLKITPQALSLDLTMNTALEELTKTLTITDGLDSAVPTAAVAWTFKSASANWLSVNTATGSTTAAETVQVTIDPSVASLPLGRTTEKLIFSYTAADNSSHDVEVPVTIVSNLPSIQVVTPYQLPNQAGTFIIRGYGFNSLSGSPKVQIAGKSYPITARDSDTQVRVPHTGFAPGSYTVKLESSSLLPLQQGAFVVPAAVAPAAQVIEAAGSRSSMVFDYERYQLYAYNETTQAIEVVSYASGSWQISKSYPIAEVSDMALTKDAKQLLLSKGNELWSIDVTSPEWPASLVYADSNAVCALRFSQLATLNDNKVAIAAQFTACTGYTSVYIYDLAKKQLLSSYSASMPVVAATGDGSKLVLGQTGVSPQAPLHVLSSLNYQLQPYNTPRDVTELTANRDGSRLLINHDEVFNGSVETVGYLDDASGKIRRVQLSQTSNRAYVLKFDSPRQQAPAIDVVNTGTVVAGTLPVERTIQLNDITEEFNLLHNPLVVTPDDKLMFITVAGRIYVKPVAVVN